MDQIEQARDILKQIGMPKKQTADVCCYTLLSIAGITPKNDWRIANSTWIGIHDIIQHSNHHFGSDYKENSRETFRKQALHHFRNAALVVDNNKPTNSPLYAYRLTTEAVALLRTYGTPDWDAALASWRVAHTSLVELYASQKRMTMMPVNINGQLFEFGTGEHNALQKAIIEQFAPRFAPGCSCLYVGDTAKKDLVKDTETLGKLGFEITLHDKMPDVVLYRPDKNWLYFIEAVTSVGPMSQKRVLEIESMTRNVQVGKIYVTAFPNFTKYKRFSQELAWETEVWLAEDPDHMIHLNGDRFLGPR